MSNIIAIAECSSAKALVFENHLCSGENTDVFRISSVMEGLIYMNHQRSLLLLYASAFPLTLNAEVCVWTLVSEMYIRLIDL
jgi:hypothetical protein